MKTVPLTRSCFVSLPDAMDQEIVVEGKIWRFDFSEHLGPIWMNKDGTDKKCQCPTNPAVWVEFEKWRKEWEEVQK